MRIVATGGSKEKIKLGVVFGGMSSEHEVALASARNVLGAVDRDRFEITPLGILKSGAWVVSKSKCDGEPVLDYLLCHADKQMLPTGMFDYLKTVADRLGVASHGDFQAELAARLERNLIISKHRLPDFEGQAPGIGGLDCVFPVLHGPMGEDGAMQGLLTIAGVAVVGCGVLASAVCMDKIVTNMVLDAARIPRAPWFGFDWTGDIPLDELRTKISGLGGYPVFVKPANTGSSIGISKVKSEGTLADAIRLAAKHDRRIVIEKGVRGRELEIAVLGAKDLIVAPVVSEIKPKREFYDYVAKYIEDSTEIELPAKVSPDVVARIQDLAKRAFRAVDGAGMARIDFFYDEEADRVYLNEINTIPGFTEISQYPAIMKTANISYRELITKLVDVALDRKRETDALER